MLNASPERLAHDLAVLAGDIGIRLAGTAGERAAADHVIARAREIGADVWEETFPVNARVVSGGTARDTGRRPWHRFPCSLFSNTPGTNGEWLSAPVAVHAPVDYQRADLGHLRGKAVIHLGCHIESRASYRRLMEARPAFLLMVDTRYPGADAARRRHVSRVHRSDWRGADVERGASRRVGMGAARRHRGTMPGSRRDGPGHVAERRHRSPRHAISRSEILYAGAHHDTQAGSPGADDNGSGVIGALELARLLHPRPRRRTIRIISFGAEEQLSVGSAAYVRTHRREVSERGRLMYNLDAYGSPLGWLQLHVNAHPDFEASFRPYFHAAGLYYQTITTVVPYADHFPFAAAGLPAVFHYRVNCNAGRFFHHRPDDDRAGCRRRSWRATCPWWRRGSTRWPPSTGCRSRRASASGDRPAIASCWDDLFGGWGA